MVDHINGVKAAITAAVGAITALLGWYGWLWILWVAAMALDYITGTCNAVKDQDWSSRVAREGLWHKAGAFFAWLAASIMDLGIGAILAYAPDINLPFSYTVLLGPLVVTWYLITEVGSIVENADKLGAPVPHWLKKVIASLKDKMDEEMNEKSDEQ